MNLKKILLSFGAAAAVAALATGGTFAVFTDSQSIAGNSIDSGSVSVQLNDSDTATQFLSVSNMVIDDTKTGTLKVENDGDNKASYVLTGSATGDSALIGAAELTIKEGSTTVLGPTPFSTFNGGAGYTVGDLTPGQDKTYTFEVSLPTQGSNTADNALQDLSFTETFDADATQRPGTNRDSGNPDA
jgi:predicted ribosomally synthesized peptide with SipW-like signal peptide